MEAEGIVGGIVLGFSALSWRVSKVVRVSSDDLRFPRSKKVWMRSTARAAALPLANETAAW